LVGGSFQKYRTMAVPVSGAQNFDLFTHALFGITIIFIPDKEPKYRTARLNTGHLTWQLFDYIALYSAFWTIK